MPKFDRKLMLEQLAESENQMFWNYVDVSKAVVRWHAGDVSDEEMHDRLQWVTTQSFAFRKMCEMVGEDYGEAMARISIRGDAHSVADDD